MTTRRRRGDGAVGESQRARARRVTKNEQAFRAYNTRREQFEKPLLPDAETTPFVCECAHRDCYAPIELTAPEFEVSHDQPDRYTVKPGHVLPEFEEVVERRDRYWVVRKFPPDAVDPGVTADAQTG